MIKKLHVIIMTILTVLIYTSLFSSEIDGLKVFVRTDKMSFYANDEILLHVTVKNITRENISFNVFDSSGRRDVYGISRGDSNDFITFRPIVYDMNGKNAELIVPYVQRSEKIAEQLKWMSKRVLVLAPGESFSHIQRLDRIYRLQPDRDYRLRLNFFPFLDDKRDAVLLSSNEIKFYYKHEKRYLADAKKSLVPHKLMPSEIILLLLNSERDRNWKRALKYIEVKKFIHSYPAFSRQYSRADDYDRKRINMDFVRFLTTQRKDSLVDFKIISEDIDSTGTQAMVEVIALRKSLGSPDRYKYKYRLVKNKKEDFLWNVSGLEARVLKGVMK